MSKKPGPDFICIGAQKAGTTWLQANLQQHSGFWLPPLKELSYFNIPRMNPVRSLTARYHPFRLARKQLATAVAKKLHGAKDTNLAWFARFIFLPRSDDWYLSLFRDGTNRISGEITPQYAPMNEAEVSHACRLCPDAQIIYILRDPIARSWSSAMHFITNDLGKTADDLGPRELHRIVSYPGIVGHSSYVENLARWKRKFPERHLLVTFFDDLVADPAGFLARILDFLGSPTDPQDLPSSIDEPRNVGSRAPIPGDIERALARRYIDDLRTLDRRFPDSPAKGWLQRAERLLAVR